VELLVSSGASVVLKNADGKTPIDVATLNEQEDVLKVLQGAAGGVFL
jgi:ankyrin repeat protein